jgi:hypothetical protein
LALPLFVADNSLVPAVFALGVAFRAVAFFATGFLVVAFFATVFLVVVGFFAMIITLLNDFILTLYSVVSFYQITDNSEQITK